MGEMQAEYPSRRKILKYRGAVAAQAHTAPTLLKEKYEDGDEEGGRAEALPVCGTPTIIRGDIVYEFDGKDNIRDSEWAFVVIIYESLNGKEYASSNNKISRNIG